MIKPDTSGNEMSQKVLVVEDDQGLRNLIVRSLEKSGFIANGVANGNQAIESFLRDQSQVLLLDQKLPDMTGRDIIEALHQKELKPPFVVMTGQGDEKLAVEMMKLGAADYLVKEIGFINLLAGILLRVFKNLYTEKKLKAAEDALRESEEKYRLIFENSPFGVMHFNPSGCISQCNRSFAQIFGSDREDLIGYNLKNHQDERIGKAVRDVLDGKTASFEGELDAVHGKRVSVKALFTPVLNEKKIVEGGIGLVEDCTSQVVKEKLEKKITIAEESLRFKQNFLANMSHEIRTPLTGILGMADILSKTPLSDIQADYLKTLQQSGENLKEIINQVLDFSKIEAGKLQLNNRNFEFRSLMANADSLFNGICKKPIVFEHFADPAIPTYIHADEMRLTQVINNLISNAVKFTDQGKITLKAELLAKQQVEHEEKLQIQIAVEDTGKGIPKSKQEKLFKPFSQIEDKDIRQYEGTGLGLSICKELVQMHGGEIHLESTPGKGSRFWFTFWAHTIDPKRYQKEKKDQKPRHMPASMNILLAEDIGVNQKVFKITLSSLGHQVTIAENGEKALELYQPGKYDLILMDIQMPVMDGITATRKLKEKYRNLPPVVGLSANAFEGDRERYMNKGMDEYLTKPLNMNEFMQVLDKLFG